MDVVLIIVRCDTPVKSTAYDKCVGAGVIGWLPFGYHDRDRLLGILKSPRFGVIA